MSAVDPWDGVDPHTLLKPKRRARPQVPVAVEQQQSQVPPDAAGSSPHLRPNFRLHLPSTSLDTVNREVRCASDRSAHLLTNTEELFEAVTAADTRPALREALHQLEVQADWAVESRRTLHTKHVAVCNCTHIMLTR